MIFQPIFSDFFCVEKLDINNEKLKEICLNKKMREPGRQVSNKGGWQSDDITKKDNDLFFVLENLINLNLLNIANLIGIKSKLILSNMWININSYKDMNMIHDHPNSVISGVYYVNIPKDSNSSFQFKNPNIKQYLFKEMLNIEYEKSNEFTSLYWSIIPENNQLFLFPSWLDHWVDPNTSQESRISIAFNSEIIK